MCCYCSSTVSVEQMFFYLFSFVRFSFLSSDRFVMKIKEGQRRRHQCVFSYKRKSARRGREKKQGMKSFSVDQSCSILGKHWYVDLPYPWWLSRRPPHHHVATIVSTTNRKKRVADFAASKAFSGQEKCLTRNHLRLPTHSRNEQVNVDFLLWSGIVCCRKMRVAADPRYARGEDAFDRFPF